VVFQTLTTVPISSGSLRVVLTDGANGYVVADAVRLVPSTSPASLSRPANSGAGFAPGTKAIQTSSLLGPAAVVASGQTSNPPNGGNPSPVGRRAAHAVTNATPAKGGLLQVLANWQPADLEWRIDLNPRPDPLQPEGVSLTFRPGEMVKALLVDRSKRA
jgi:hypothetical protein